MARKQIIKKVYLDNLPHKGKIIDWRNSIGYKIRFIYDDIEDYIDILEYISGNMPKLKIKYKDKEHIITLSGFINCSFGNILNKITKYFKIEIGQVFVDDKRDITIIDREYRKNPNNKGKFLKWYKYHCNKCGAELWMIETSLLDGHTCACCCNQVVIKGINDIYTTNPELINYFVNIEDTYKYTTGTNEMVLMRCLCCGYEKFFRINSLYNQRFSCPRCGDGISYPEKFMFNFLQQLLGDDFTYQYSKANNNWCNNYKYDFYFKLLNEQFIVETHGEQHYKEDNGKWSSSKDIQLNDKIKKELALVNGIKEKDYITIDCKYSNLEYIKQNILKSNLSKLFDLSAIDWNKCNKQAINNKVKEICEYWNKQENKDIKELALKFKLCLATIRNYLKIGNEIKWCVYESNPNNKKEVEILKNGISIGTFSSSAELDRQSEKLFGIHLDYRGISAVCNGVKNKYKGFEFVFI